MTLTTTIPGMRALLALLACAPFAVVLFAATPHAEASGEKDLGTLDEINIEGEIPLPQVLFISSREQPRYADKVHERYVTGLDSWLAGPIFPESIITVPKGLIQQEDS